MAGDAISGTGGIRKLRLSAKGKGKRGGSRVIYVYVASRLRVYLLLAYDKSQRDDLSTAGRRYLRARARAFEEEP